MSKNTNIKVVTGLVRFANVHLYKPISWVEGESPKYSVTLIIPKSDTKTVESINSAYAQVLELSKSKLTNKPMIPYGLKDGDVERGGEEKKGTVGIRKEKKGEEERRGKRWEEYWEGR